MQSNRDNAQNPDQKRTSLFDKLEKCKKENGVHEMKNMTSDMHPAVQYGDLITMKPCTVDDLNEGDIFCLKDGSGFKMRRFVKRKFQYNTMYVVGKTESDKTCDDPIKPSLVFAKIIANKRNGKPVALKDESLLRKILVGLGLFSFSS